MYVPTASPGLSRYETPIKVIFYFADKKYEPHFNAVQEIVRKIREIEVFTLLGQDIHRQQFQNYLLDLFNPHQILDSLDYTFDSDSGVF